MGEALKQQVPFNWGTLITLFVVLGAVIASFVRTETRLTDHLHSTDVHMTYAEKVTEFVPRTEVETILGEMKDDITEIKVLVRELQKAQMDKE